MTADILDQSLSADRMPRHDIVAEQSVLGAIMTVPRALDDVVTLLRPSDFYRGAHQHIYELILGLSRRGEPYDFAAVGSEIINRGLVRETGGPPYVHTLVQNVPVAAQALHYAKVVRKAARMRILGEIGMRLVAKSMDGDADEVDAYIEQAHAALVESDEHPDDPPLWGDILPEFMDELENGTDEKELVPTPYQELDHLLGGFRPGQLITIGARPAVGKSVVASDIARAAAFHHDVPVYFACLEMSRLEIAKRMVAAEEKIPMHKLTKEHMTEEYWSKVDDLMKRTARAPMVIDDSPNVTLSSIRANLRRMQRRSDIPPMRMLVLDYLQLMSTTSRVENRQVAVSEMSRGLKLIAKEFRIPVVMLSQLNRGPEQRTDKKPVVSDLRESGSIEQDSDVVILLHRDDVYDRETPRAGEMDVIVGKNRNGPTATITTAFQGHYARAVNMGPQQ